MKPIRVFRFTVLAAAVLVVLLTVPTSRADIGSAVNALFPEPHVVAPGDTFSFAVYGYNSTTGAGVLLTPVETAIFGTTQTFTGAGPNGQDITIFSSEAGGLSGSNRDGFSLTTPTTFITAATYSSLNIDTLRFEIGGFNSGSNTVDLVFPIASYTTQSEFQELSGRIFLGYNTMTALSNNNRSFAAAVPAFTGSNTHSFIYNINYAYTVPEPSTVVVTGIGCLALLTGASYRHRRGV